MTAPIEIALYLSITVNVILIYLLVQAVNRWLGTKDTLSDLRDELSDSVEVNIELEAERDVWRRDAETSLTSFRKAKGEAERLAAHLAESTEKLSDSRYACEILGVRVDSASELIFAVMRDEVNAQDEAEKWLRDYAPAKLREAYPTDTFHEDAARAALPAKAVELMRADRDAGICTCLTDSPDPFCRVCRPEDFDPVNHPKHYCSHPSGVECITVVEHMGFNLGNAIKYIWRADEKGKAVEDLRKAAFYVNREIDKRDGKAEPGDR